MKLTVVGDALLDRDVEGRCTRVTPDAPVPVVDVQSVRERPGGAALAAAVAAEMGADVTLVCALAADGPGGRLRALLTDRGVNVVGLPDDGRTAEKVRVRVGEHSLLRLDQGHSGALGDPPAATAEALQTADAVLVADYGRGVAAHSALRSQLERCVATGTPLVWDPHLSGPPPVERATVVVPNRKEAAALAPDIGAEGLAGDVQRARELRRRWSVGALAVTLGSDGAVAVWSDGAPLVVPVLVPQRSGDTCGAGDAFAASLAIALGSGRLLSEAVEQAVVDAADFVASGAAAARAAAGPLRTVEPTPLPREARREVVVATGGCFDLLHAGHTHLLRNARRLGDRLVVLLNSDRSIRGLKGSGRPLQPAADRESVLRSLRFVDDVIVFDDDTPIPTLERLRPDIFVKGGDYTAAELPEARAVAGWNGTVVTVPYLLGRSTTSLIRSAEREVRHVE
jgi:rfaE bifunctional protein nucleotidyltransferase chain/domain/rfaE bifunctional protein kinase chain/domain